MSSPALLTPTDDRILAYIREGTTDAEIAVRMGMTIGDTKERIARLIRRLGAEDRDGLRHEVVLRPAEPAPAVAEAEPIIGDPAEEVPRQRRAWLSSLLLGAAMGAFGGLALVLLV